MPAHPTRRQAFTLVEILIVVVILAILASIVLPQFSGAADTARENNTRALLFTLRNQIELYKMHHNATYPTIAQLWDNLPHATDVNGTIDASGRFGPYLKKAPMNEYTKSTTVAAIGAGAATDGWEYDPATGEINAVGFDEDTGTFTSP